MRSPTSTWTVVQTFLRWHDATASKHVLFLSRGDGSFVASTSFNLNTDASQLRTLTGTTTFVIGDFTGDGAPQILRLKVNPNPGEAAGNQLYWKNNKSLPDRLIAATTPTGLRTVLTWFALANPVLGGVSRYTNERSGSFHANYPVVDLTGPISVVGTMITDSGRWHFRGLTTEFSYAGLKGAYDGRGSARISRSAAAESRRGRITGHVAGSPVTVITQYLQGFPLYRGGQQDRNVPRESW